MLVLHFLRGLPHRRDLPDSAPRYEALLHRRRPEAPRAVEPPRDRTTDLTEAIGEVTGSICEVTGSFDDGPTALAELNRGHA